MKGATHCARRLKQLLRAMRTRHGKVAKPAVGDPVTQLVLGVFTRDVPESKAREALDSLRAAVVDYNELRVIPPLELAELVGDYPDVRTKCEDLSRALNRVFAIEHLVSLDRLTTMSRKDSRAFLDRLDGLEAYSRARVLLLGLQHHAMPLDEAMWAYARSAGVVDAGCSHAEAQAFLERQINEDDALEFFTLLRKEAWTEVGALVRRGDVEHIRSVPPDRTSRNMLQPITPIVVAAPKEPEERGGPGARKPRGGSTKPETKSAAKVTDKKVLPGKAARVAPRVNAPAKVEGSAKRRRPSPKAKSA